MYWRSFTRQSQHFHEKFLSIPCSSQTRSIHLESINFQWSSGPGSYIIFRKIILRPGNQCVVPRVAIVVAIARFSQCVFNLSEIMTHPSAPLQCVMMITFHAPSMTTKWNKNAMYPPVFTMRGLSPGSGGPVHWTINILQWSLKKHHYIAFFWS